VVGHRREHAEVELCSLRRSVMRQCLFVIVRNSITPQLQCILELNGPKSFNFNEFAGLTPNGDFIYTAEALETLSERLLPKKKEWFAGS
jgi:hypothetical protein